MRREFNSLSEALGSIGGKRYCLHRGMDQDQVLEAFSQWHIPQYMKWWVSKDGHRLQWGMPFQFGTAATNRIAFGVSYRSNGKKWLIKYNSQSQSRNPESRILKILDLLDEADTQEFVDLFSASNRNTGVSKMHYAEVKLQIKLVLNLLKMRWDQFAPAELQIIATHEPWIRTAIYNNCYGQGRYASSIAALDALNLPITETRVNRYFMNNSNRLNDGTIQTLSKECPEVWLKYNTHLHRGPKDWWNGTESQVLKRIPYVDHKDLRKLNRKWSGNAKVMLCALKQWNLKLPVNPDKTLWNSKRFVLEAVKLYPLEKMPVPEHLKCDPDIVIAAFDKNLRSDSSERYYGMIPEALCSDPDFLMKLVKRCPYALNHVDFEWDKKWLLDAVAINPNVLWIRKFRKYKNSDAIWMQICKLHPEQVNHMCRAARYHIFDDKYLFNSLLHHETFPNQDSQAHPEPDSPLRPETIRAILKASPESFQWFAFSNAIQLEEKIHLLWRNHCYIDDAIIEQVKQQEVAPEKIRLLLECRLSRKNRNYLNGLLKWKSSGNAMCMLNI
jgi:hypothetical protein